MLLPYSMPGSIGSAPYIARPVTFGTPSGLIGRVPEVPETQDLTGPARSALDLRQAPGLVRNWADGEMAERLKAHAWKACVRESVPWVRIPLSPPVMSYFRCYSIRKS